MSLLMGLISLATLYFWFTVDWWRPPTLLGTRISIEDFMVGFFPGGIMAVIYEVIFKKRLYKRKPKHHVVGGVTLMVLLALVTEWMILVMNLTSFWASSISLISVAGLIVFLRKDLFFNALGSAVLMLIASLPFYYTIILLSPEWIDITYLPTLSGIRTMGIPIEELVFWFLAGLVWGPFYEYWQGERCRKMSYRSSSILH